MTDDDSDDLCPSCNGSGEGMHDGSSCGSCNGRGVARDADEEYERECERADRYYDMIKEREWAGV